VNNNKRGHMRNDLIYCNARCTFVWFRTLEECVEHCKEYSADKISRYFYDSFFVPTNDFMTNTLLEMKRTMEIVLWKVENRKKLPDVKFVNVMSKIVFLESKTIDEQEYHHIMIGKKTGWYRPDHIDLQHYNEEGKIVLKDKETILKENAARDASPEGQQALKEKALFAIML
jgi:hypothetical protein